MPRRLLPVLAALALLCPVPASAGYLPLCTGTTGTSPCPFPNRAIAPSDTFDVLPGNIVAVNVPTPSGFMADSGLFRIQTGGAFTLDGWAWLRTLATGVVDVFGTITSNASLQAEDDAVMRVRPGALLTCNIDFSIYDDGQLVNEGTVENAGYVYTLIDPSNDPPGDPDNPTIDNRGLWVNHAGADVPNDGAFSNSGTYMGEAGSLFSGTGSLFNSGTFASAGEVTNTVYDVGGGVFVNSGDFRLASTGFLDRSTVTRPWGSYRQTAGRTTANGPVSQSLIYVMAGSWEGAGALRGVVRVGDGAGAPATLSPGDSLNAIATLAITGSLALASDARVVFDLASGGVYDRVNSTTRDTLGGELALRLSAVSPPAVGDTLTLMTATTAITGAFATVTVNGAPNAGQVSVVLDGKRVRVVVLANVGVGTAAERGLRLAVLGGTRAAELQLDLPRGAHARVTVFDVSGRTVAELVDRDLGAGSHRFALDGHALPSGVYFARASVRDAAGLHERATRFVRLR